MGNTVQNQKQKQAITVTPTAGKCPIGEKIGAQNIMDKSIPVVSCEGGCIRGEIARLAANYVSKVKPFKRGCHGELFTVPDSQIAVWMKTADKVVCIDGCFLKCHSRIIENIIDPSKLLVFDALSHYQKFTDFFEIDDVPENIRKETALKVTDWIIQSVTGNLKINSTPVSCQG